VVNFGIVMASRDKDRKGNVTLLDPPPVDSPEIAVRVQIVKDAKGKK
jgi:hypothetical protein